MLTNVRPRTKIALLLTAGFLIYFLLQNPSELADYSKSAGTVGWHGLQTVYDSILKFLHKLNADGQDQ